jgi:hypothetical protein
MSAYHEPFTGESFTLKSREALGDDIEPVTERFDGWQYDKSITELDDSRRLRSVHNVSSIDTLTVPQEPGFAVFAWPSSTDPHCVGNTIWHLPQTSCLRSTEILDDGSSPAIKEGLLQPRTLQIASAPHALPLEFMRIEDCQILTPIKKRYIHLVIIFESD